MSRLVILTPSVLDNICVCEVTSLRNCVDVAAKAPASAGVLNRSNAPRGVVASCGRLSQRKYRAPADAKVVMLPRREATIALSVVASCDAVSPGVSTALYRSFAPPQKT